jgi:uncharacterized RDD family membrane protein YckC
MPGTLGVVSSLVTGEAVVLDVRTAGLASRMLAALIDGAIQVIMLIALFVMVGLFGGGGSGAALAALGIVSFVSVLVGYPVLFETLMRGRTPGKVALGLRVVRDDAGPIGFRQAFVRGMVGLVEKPMLSYAPAVICSLAHEQGKRLGDLAAGTIVIQERVLDTGRGVAQMPPQLAAWATTLDLSRLPDDLAQAVRAFLARQGSMTQAARDDLGGRLCAAVAAVVTPPAPPGTPGWAYLSAVLAERRRRAQEHQASVTPVVMEPRTPAPPPAAPPQPPPPPPAEGGFAAPW